MSRRIPLNLTRLLGLVVLTSAALLSGQAPAAPAGTTYYVAASGNDSNDGTSQSTPWASIAKVNSVKYSAGQHVLFKGGDKFKGCLVFSGLNITSNKNNPITLGTYGTGRPTITSDCPGSNSGDTGPKSAALIIDGLSGFTVDGLILRGSPDATPTQFGILIENDGDGSSDTILIENTDVGGFQTNATGDFSSEIMLLGMSVAGNCGPLYNVRFRGNTLHGVSGPKSKDDNGITGYGCDRNITNVTYEGNTIYDIGGDDNSSSGGNGILVGGVNGAIVQYNLVHDLGGNMDLCGGPAGLWVYGGNNVTIQFNEVYHVRPLIDPGSGCDWDGIGFDGGVTNSIVQYNYVHDNAGSGLYTCVFCGIDKGPWGPNTFRYNIGENDNSVNSTYEGELGLGNKGHGGTLYVYNNTLYNATDSSDDGNSPCVSLNLGSFAKGLIANNICIVASKNKSGKVTFFDDNKVGAAGLTIINNIWYNSSGGTALWNWKGQAHTAFASWVAASRLRAPGSSTDDPGLAGAGAGGTCRWTPTGGTGPVPCPEAYKLTQGSPALAQGLNLAAKPYSLDIGSRDYFGAALLKGAGAKYNIGADGAVP